ncbi:Uncharacterised protein [uncultured Clostridium sp.]|nr:Uncharacterised protein [uncultured Clostridium sp.]
MAEFQRCGALILVIDIKDDAGVLDNGDLREIDAGKSIEALGTLLFGSGSGNDFSAEHDVDSVRPVVRGKTKAVQKIGPGIGDGKVDGLLGSGDDHRLPVILDEIG